MNLKNRRTEENYSFRVKETLVFVFNTVNCDNNKQYMTVYYIINFDHVIELCIMLVNIDTSNPCLTV